jgi:hypothetical protein
MAKAKSKQQDADSYFESVKRKATAAMDMLDPARRAAQGFQKYYDGFQWTDDELRVLEARKQPALTFNHVKPAVNAIIGIVERGRTDPKGWGRTPKDQEAAEVATDGLRYVADITRYNVTARECLQDFLIWGVVAGINEADANGEFGIRRIRPEEFFYDPYSRDRDFGDARYMGIAKWMDEQDLIDLYPDAADKIKTSFDFTAPGDTFADRPRDGWSWVDTKKRRIMCFEMYSRRGAEWKRCVFVYGGILEEGPSPYLDSKSKRPRNPIIAQSAYVDIENNRYGVVKDMMSPQDAINKARSKAVHILNVSKLRVSRQVQDIDGVRREWAKPDGIIEADEGQIEELGDRQLAPAHLELLRDAKEEMRRQSPTPGIVGRQGSAQSGRAILAEQQAGLTEQAPLLAGFDDWKLRCYRAMWESIKQFWTAPKWVRVTDDEMSPRFVGINIPEPVVDPMTGQPQIDPATGQPITRVQNNPAEMDVDIVIDSTPDTAVIQEEQFQRLAELAQAGMPISPDVLIEASSLPKKKQLLDKLKQAQEQQSQQPDMAMQAEMQKAQMQMQAEQQKLEMQSQARAQDLMREDEADQRKTERAMQLADIQFKYDIERLNRQAEIETGKAQAMLEIKRAEKMADLEFGMQSKQMDFEFKGLEAERNEARQSAKDQEATMAPQKPDKTMEALGAGLLAIGRGQEALAQALSKPKQIQRGPDGRAQGII